MVSKYGIITIADLEAFAHRDYSSYVDQAGVRLYSDTEVEAAISYAEQLVSSIARKTTYDSTAPDEIITAVKKLASIHMDNHMIDDGIIESAKEEEILYFQQIIKPLIESFETKKNAIVSFESVSDYI